jgi:hypothetical protein
MILVARKMAQLNTLAKTWPLNILKQNAIDRQLYRDRTSSDRFLLLFAYKSLQKLKFSAPER